MRKKILMLCSVWHGNYIDCLLRGIRKRIENEEVEVHVFMVYDALSDSEFLMKEQEIFELADISNYDGVLVAVNSVGNVALVEEKLREYRKSGKKILSIDQKYEGASFAGIDNYQIFYEMVEHMVTEHDCKVFNYLGGPAEHEENKERYRAFCECLQKHGIPVDEKRVCHKSFLNSDGIAAYEEWKAEGLHLPDVVMCANDYMALGYLSAAEADGYQPPIDYRIAGFDNFEEGQFYSPSLTSVNRNWEKLGYDSIDKLLQLGEGTVEMGEFFSPGKLALNESCGCGLDKRDVRKDLQNVYREKRYEERLEVRQRMNRELLCSSGSIEELQKNLHESYNLLGGMDMVLCLEGHLFWDNYDPDAEGGKTMVAVSLNGRKELTTSDFFAPHELLQGTDDKVIVYTSLHFGSDSYGFCIAVHQDNFLQNNFYRTFKDTMGLALENIRQREELRRVNQRLQELYVQDPLTGLYNRSGYVTFAEEYFTKHCGEVFLAYVDVDNLKVINDNYDHSMGDKAIIGVARAIREVFAGDNIHVRMGGDEFLVLGGYLTDEELLHKAEEIREYLENYSDEEELPFVLRASVGHVNNSDAEESLEALVKRADDKMYEVKQKRKTKSIR
ncbi:MAG: GGDEF domain-containing protein [Lachnospiraceae bacterium]|nr:GGDEF domain-containing protein [Lachnospiraceae bacterium]